MMPVESDLEASLFLEALMVALVGGAGTVPISLALRDRLVDFGMTFGAALRHTPGMLNPQQHATIRAIAERAIADARKALK